MTDSTIVHILSRVELRWSAAHTVRTTYAMITFLNATQYASNKPWRVFNAAPPHDAACWLPTAAASGQAVLCTGEFLQTN